MNVDPWSTPRLRATVERFLGVGSDADLPQPVRFVRSVATLVRRRVKSEADANRFAYFLLHPPGTAESPEGRDVTRVAMLDLGLDRVTGRLWFVNCLANDGLAIEIAEAESHTQIVDLVTGELGLGEVPALVVDMASDTTLGRYFPNGLSDLESATPVVFSAQEVTWARIRDSVDGVHRTSLITPELQNRADNLWAKADHYWSASDAEYKVQSAVKCGLAGALPYCDIRSEQPQAEGRHDLLIEEYIETPEGIRTVVPHAMIELKVLRSRNSVGTSVSDNETRQWAVSGVKQAHAYGAGRHSRLLLTFLFDARLPSASMDCLSEAYELAQKLDVTVGRWKLYGRSSDLRDDMTAGATSE